MTKYKFKGYTITNCGYHQPDHCVWWEAVNENGEACFHGNTLREVEFMILDDEWEQKMRRKDEEIEKLKASTVGNAIATRKALENLIAAVLDYHENASRYVGRQMLEVLAEPLNEANYALSEPPRNCDVGTPEEHQNRFRGFCRLHDSKGECGIGRSEAACPAFHGWRNPDCSLWWAQMPYEGKEASND